MNFKIENNESNNILFMLIYSLIEIFKKKVNMSLPEKRFLLHILRKSFDICFKHILLRQSSNKHFFMQGNAKLSNTFLNIKAGY